MPSPLQNLICAAFPGVVVHATHGVDAGLPTEVLDVYLVPDERLEEFRSFVVGVLAERAASDGAVPTVVLPHTVSWTRENAPSVGVPLGPE